MSEKELYKNVKTYEELLKLNIDFINGVIKWTPYHQKEISIGPLKDQLIKTNELGFLTFGGQCAEDTPHEQRKLFLDGYIKPNLVRNFIKHLKKFKKFEYFIEFPENKEIKTNIRDWHNTDTNNTKLTNVKNLYFNSLARSKKENEQWTNIGILPFGDLSYVTLDAWKGFDNIINILKEYCFVHIQHRSFHNLNNDIYTVINGFLKKQVKKEKINSFGGKKKRKFKELKLKELIRDLKKLESNSFGIKESKIKRGASHIREHGWKYAAGIGNLIALSVLKNRINNRLNKGTRHKDRRQREEMHRRILNEELDRRGLVPVKK
jgi:hypothetical protein